MDYVQSLQHDDGHVTLMKLIKLIKPGIIFGNIVTLCGGFFVAVQGNFSWIVFLSALIGMAFVIACGCVLNNYIDRDIDQLMKRTQKRPSACGLVSLRFALSYAFILGIVGFMALYLGTNNLTVIIAAIGLFAYVVAYTLWFKRSSIFGTVVGAISGAVPPVIGYTAVTNRFDAVALTLFIILVCWQMPHFFAIAIYRKDDYAAANIPVLPLKRSMLYTQVNALIFVVLYVIATLMLAVVAHVHLLYLAVAFILGIAWIALSIKGFKAEDKAHWARKMFIFSIVSITLLSIFMAV
ncbi:heme o synthase [Cysteiniphilum sp. JM-1]|uniref:heme o synthase n=1 Tax=Cysteiniphilum TaxID=2056696 RepID=UPI0012491F9D|nr:heme o synthase [Cysteiniphilum sp. JM-1]